MNRNIKVGRIDYINVDPLYFNFNIKKEIKCDIIAKPPSSLNKMLAEGELDISPVSSAAYARNADNWLILPNLCVSCFGDVMSVIFASDVPIEKLEGKEVWVSDESRTAADLIKIFFYSQKINPVFTKKKIKEINDSNNRNASVIIGDAALKFDWHKRFKYVWDLGDLWQHMTDLPFVFALWAARKDFADKNGEVLSRIIKEFYISKEKGLKNIDVIIEESALKLYITFDKCREYFKCLNFDLKEKQIRGLEIFFNGLYEYGILGKKVPLNFFKA